MSEIAQTDEIDRLLSSVRHLVAQKDATGQRARTKSELLVLSPASRVDEEDAPETPVEYTPASPPEQSNVHRLAPEQQPERTSLEATIAELEVAVTRQPEDWDPDEDEVLAPATDAIQQRPDDSPKVPQPPRAPRSVRSKIVSQITQEVESALGIRQVARDPVHDVDEDTLRAMVEQIIREELSGELGEKITRNVRKLVRREINRALTSHALD